MDFRSRAYGKQITDIIYGKTPGHVRSLKRRVLGHCQKRIFNHERAHLPRIYEYYLTFIMDTARTLKSFERFVVLFFNERVIGRLFIFYDYIFSKCIDARANATGNPSSGRHVQSNRQ